MELSERIRNISPDPYCQQCADEVAELKVKNAKYRETLRTIMFATTLPPMALNDNEGFYRRELQRCIGDAARALDSQEDNVS